MAKGIPRLEADLALFERPRPAPATKPVEAAEPVGGAEEGASAEAPPPIWRALGLARLEALAPDARTAPPAVAEAPGEAAEAMPEGGEAMPEGGEAMPEGGEEGEGPEFAPEVEEEAFEPAFEEASVDPEAADWLALADITKGGPALTCLGPLLAALGWRGGVGPVAAALPFREDGGRAPFTGQDIAETMDRLGYPARVRRCRLTALQRGDFPCLFVADDGRRLALLEFGQSSFPAHDGAADAYRQVPRDRSTGTVYSFRAIEDEAPAEPSRPETQAAGLWSIPLAEIRRVGQGRLLVQSVLANGLSLAVPLFALLCVDRAIPAGAVAEALFFGTAAVLALCLEWGLRAVRDGRLAGRGADVPRTWKARAVDRVLALAPGRVLAASAGLQQTRLDQFAAEDDPAAARLLPAVVDLPFVILPVALMAWFAGWLAVVPIAALAVGILAAVASMPGLKGVAAVAVEAAGRYRALDRDAERGHRDLRDCGADDHWRRRIADRAALAGWADERFAGRVRWLEAAAGVLSGTAVVAVAVIGSRQALAEQLSAGALTASILLSLLIVAPAVRGLARLGDWARLGLARDQTAALLALVPERARDAPPPIPRPLAGYIDFDRVSSPYEGGAELPLREISFHVDAGEVVAVVGDYLSGRSAVLRLLADLVRPEAGNIRLDGLDIRQLGGPATRRSTAYVPEEPQFLPGSIEHNLRLAEPAASDAELRRACDLAGVAEDVRVLESGLGPHRRFGFDVRMEDLPEEPSPGFYKRLSLARGYLRRTGPLLLDNPDRGLTPDQHQALDRAVEYLRGGRTIVIATDRPGQIRLADTVVWLEAGRIRAVGPSDDVLPQLFREGGLRHTAP